MRELSGRSRPPSGLAVAHEGINSFVAGGQNIFINSGPVMRAEALNQLIGALSHRTGHIAGDRTQPGPPPSLGPRLLRQKELIYAGSRKIGDPGARLRACRYGARRRRPSG
jgi:hypothetical protein